MSSLLRFARAALPILAFAALQPSQATEAALSWLSSQQVWTTAVVQPVPRESFVGWLQARGERSRAAEAAETMRAAVKQRHDAAGLDRVWREALLERTKQLLGTDVAYRQLRDRGMRLQDAHAVLRQPPRGSVADPMVISVATDFVLARDGRSFEVQIIAGHRAAGSDGAGKAVRANYHSPQAPDAAALLAPGVLEAELRQAAAFAAEVALQRVVAGATATRRVTAAFDGSFLSEPLP